MSTDPSPRTTPRALSSLLESKRSSWIIQLETLADRCFRGLHRGCAAPRLVVDQPLHGRVVAAQRAGLVAAQLQLAERHVLALEQQVPADHRLADVQEVLDRLEGHHAADDP